MIGRQGLRALSTVVAFALLIGFTGHLADDERGVADAAPQRAAQPHDRAGAAAPSDELLKQSIGPGTCEYVAVTQVTLCDVFRDYWYRYGGLATFGYPMSWEMMENGKRVQYFERAKFEYQPFAAGTEWAVVGELLGHTVSTGRENEAPFQYIPDVAAPTGCMAFVETGHTLCNGFEQYWNNHGGLWLFGYPISEEFQEQNPDDGQVYTVQYFERARFEYHPENAGTPYEVLLGRLGNTVFQQRYDSAFHAVFNVRDFGALGNGAADDTDSFAAAFDAARAAKPAGIVYVPAGTYMLRGSSAFSDTTDGRLILGHGSTLVGENWETTVLKLIPGSVDPSWPNARVVLVTDDTRVTNLTFDGSRNEIDRSQINGIAMSLIRTREGSSNIVLENLRVHDAYAQKQGDVRLKEAFGIACAQASNVSIRQIEGYDNDGSAISVGGDIYGIESENVSVENVLVHGNRTQGVTFYGARSSTAFGAIAYNNLHGMNVEWSQNITIGDVQTYSNERAGVSMFGVSSGVVLQDIDSWDNGSSMQRGSEIGIFTGRMTNPDPTTGVVAVGVAQDVTIVNSELTPAAGKTQVYLWPTPSETTVGSPVPQAIRLQSSGAESWSFNVDDTVVSADQFPEYILATYGVAIQTQ